MASFGENLRREREMRGVTLEEISVATKISVRFLQAIEREDFSVLPGGIFTRSFIRAYAKYLGLDEERILPEYQLVAQPDTQIEPNRIAITKTVPQPESFRTPLLALFVASVILGGGYLLYRHSHRAVEVQEKGMTPGQVSAATSPSPPQFRERPASARASAAATATSSSARSAPGGQHPTQEAPSEPSPPVLTPGVAKDARAESDLVLQVAATERAWVAVDADGKTAFQRILNPNEVRTVKAKESFDVITGNAQGIILTLNSETLKPLGGPNAYKKIHLTHDDLKNPSP